jgi:hypothetical protein
MLLDSDAKQSVLTQRLGIIGKSHVIPLLLRRLQTSPTLSTLK